MRWMEKEFADYERIKGQETGKSSLVLFNEIAEKVAPGSDGVVFLPYMSGERSPIWDPNAKGVFSMLLTVPFYWSFSLSIASSRDFLYSEGVMP